MKLILIVSIAFTVSVLFAQTRDANIPGTQIVQRLEKWIVSDSSIFFYQPSTHQSGLFSLVCYSNPSVDTIFKYTLPSGNSEKKTICWDILDKKLIKISLFADNQGQANSHLRYYEIDSLKNRTSKGLKLFSRYVNSGFRSLSAYIPPFDLYNNMIYYRTDTLRGNLYLDFTCEKDLFLFYIYIDGQKSLEKWQYTPFSRLLGYEKATEKLSQKSWVRIGKYDIDLSGPFRTFAANNKNYLITENGRIMLILADSIKEMSRIADIEQKVLVFDKAQNQLRTIKKKSLDSIKVPLSPEAIYRKSKLVIDFNR